MRELGLLSIYLAFFAVLLAAFINTKAVIRLLRPQSNGKGKRAPVLPDIRPARLAMIFSSVCLFTAGAALMHCFWTHRFDIEYIFNSSSLALRKPFLIAAFWNGQEGTFLLWSFYLSLWGLLLLGRKNILATLFPPPEPKLEAPKAKDRNAKPSAVVMGLENIGRSLREPFATAVHNWFLIAMMTLLLVRSPFHYIGPTQKWEAFLEFLNEGAGAHESALKNDPRLREPRKFFGSHGLKVSVSKEGDLVADKVESKWQEVTRLAGFTGKPDHKIIQPHDGKGLNELLQNPWMCIHPPIMFVGYSALALPFFFAIAALIARRYDWSPPPAGVKIESSTAGSQAVTAEPIRPKGWIDEAFPFLMFPWAALGIGLTLGGAWAYGVLGWHGYWAWDPVENASLFPWLTATALIHGMVLQRKRGSFARANFAIAILAHLLVLYGTFLTRSGILTDASVHSFTSEGNELYWTLVIIGGLTIMVSYGITPLLPMLGVLFLLNKSGYAAKAAKAELLPKATEAARMAYANEVTLYTGIAIFVGVIVAAIGWSVLARTVTGKPLNRRMLLFGLLGSRWNEIRSDASYEDTGSRDFFLFTGIIAITASAAMVTLGTSSPIVMTLLHWSSKDIKQVYEGMVQNRFYNVAHVPIGMTMALAMALWRYFPWRGGGTGRLLRDLPRHLCAALLITVGMRIYLGWSGAQTGASPMISNMQWALIACSSFALVSNLTLMASLIHRSTWKSGPFIAHTGVALLFVGVIISSAYEKTEQLNLRKGKPVAAFDNDFMFKLVSDDVNPRPGDVRYLWDRDYLIIEYWENHGKPHRVRRAYPIVSLNNAMEYINVPFIAKQAMIDWYFAAGRIQDPSRLFLGADKLGDEKVSLSKGKHPVMHVTGAEPAAFKDIPDLRGHSFRLKGYQMFTDQATEQGLPMALLVEVKRRDSQPEDLTLKFTMRPRDVNSAEPVQIPGTSYMLIVADRSEDPREMKSYWQLRVLGGYKWLQKPDDINDETPRNSVVFPALPEWKFRLKYPDLPGGMMEGKIDKDAAIRAVLEVTHGSEKHELQPGMGIMDRSKQIPITVPGTDYQVALESARPNTKEYLITLVRKDWTNYWVVEVTHKPMINFVWIGVGVMVLGGLMSLKNRAARAAPHVTSLD